MNKILSLKVLILSSWLFTSVFFVSSSYSELPNKKGVAVQDQQSYLFLVDEVKQGRMTVSELADLLIETTQASGYPEGLLAVQINLPGFSEELSQRLVVAVPQILASGSDDNNRQRTIAGYKELAKRNLSSADPKKEQILKFFQILENFDNASKTGSIENIVSLRQQATEPVYQNIIEPKIRNYLNAQAKIEQGSSKYASMLRTLAVISPEWRNDETITLLKSVIKVLGQEFKKNPPSKLEEFSISNGQKIFLFDEIPVQSLLLHIATLSKSDTSFQPILSSFMEQLIIDRLNLLEHKSAAKFYQLLLIARPDPDSENTKFRDKLIFSYSNNREIKQFISELVKVSNTGQNTGLMQKITLFHQGYYGEEVPLVFYASIFVGFALLVIFRTRPQILAKAKPINPEELKSDPSKMVDKKSAIKEDEYSRLLKLFSLDDQATEEEIKNAYRQQLKIHHPDVASSENAQDDKVMELKQTYDRILEIRRSWFHRPS